MHEEEQTGEWKWFIPHACQEKGSSKLLLHPHDDNSDEKSKEFIIFAVSTSFMFRIKHFRRFYISNRNHTIVVRSDDSVLPMLINCP